MKWQKPTLFLCVYQPISSILLKSSDKALKINNIAKQKMQSCHSLFERAQFLEASKIVVI